MKCFFQLLDSKTGSRSPAIGQDRIAFAQALKNVVPEDEQNDVYVLVLVEDANADQWKFSSAPAMTVHSFINLFGNLEVASNV